MKTPLKTTHQPMMALFLLLALLSEPLLAQDKVDRESRVRAAFVYKFINFVEWPPKAFEATAGDMRICVVGSDRFGEVLSNTVNGKAVKQRPLQATAISSPAELDRCQVLYIGDDVAADEWLEASRNRPVLTVSSRKDFALEGGMIQLVIDGGKMRFDVNRRSADESGLSVSSRLLKVARNVRAT